MAWSGVRNCIVGVDVGGTNTDAVLLCKEEVCGTAKTTTTDDITSGVARAIVSAVNDAVNKGYRIAVGRIHIGTTHFINAVIQRKNLAKVAVIRLCGPSTRSLPPFSDFPEDLKKEVCGLSIFASGGFQYDGTVLTPIDEVEICQHVEELKAKGIQNVVITGVFSPTKPEQEIQVSEIIHKAYPACSITKSHTIGQIGLLERENAAILNESLKPISKQTVNAFRLALKQVGLSCPFFLTQNDGTLISASKALEHPVSTFSSGPTNSMRGAAFLSGVQDAVVIDIGGTTTDVGVLEKGFPKEAATRIRVGGVNTNFHMPDVVSIGLGGGSKILEKRNEDNELTHVQVGPQSVGHHLEQEAVIFGGNTLTTSDVAVATGLLDIGDRGRVEGRVTKHLCSLAQEEIQNMLAVAIDSVKIQAADIPVVLVGGGSVLVDEKKWLPGVSAISKPPHFDVANAVGAALSQVSGSVDHVVKLPDRKYLQGQQVSETEKLEFESARNCALDEAKTKAIQECVAAGADPASVHITEVAEVPLAYLPGNATRIHIHAVGSLQTLDGSTEHDTIFEPGGSLPVPPEIPGEVSEEQLRAEEQRLKDHTLTEVTAQQVPPTITPSGEWELSPWDIECISVGAGIMGCGGGGSPYLGRLRCLRALKEGKKIKIVTPDRSFLCDKKAIQNEKSRVKVGSHALSTPVRRRCDCICSIHGCTVSLTEKIPCGRELPTALRVLEDLYLRHQYKDGQLKNSDVLKLEEGAGITYISAYPHPPERTGSMGARKLAAIMCAEIGGWNAMEPLIVAAEIGLPVVDCDGMGRAFPELQMFAPSIYGKDMAPACITDDCGNQGVILTAGTAKDIENHFRAAIQPMGLSAGLTMAPLNKDEMMKTTVLYSMSQTWRLGNSILCARKQKTSILDAVIQESGGKVLLVGKVVDVERSTEAGFTRGKIKVAGTEPFSGQHLHVDFQNELLVARHTRDGHNFETLACTPDLITMVTKDAGEPIPNEEMRYGLRVVVFALPVSPVMRSPKALKVVGPQAFGYSADHVVYTSLCDDMTAHTTPVGPL
ncbi:uncharacterized protein LOC106170126 [Lingula anatina]|uniref:Uncharacterized protein LOC106170126 n=1 Tax=Lingula anatina TaxID=7574 RepID=A0A1S3J657_LINAN|nr:uncharacterized protein LOC106170126 [Lingula anatina]|eukprot:XP_013405324.1 uncharacterized protein LOC106170126 [Lingula anatina]